MLYIDDAETEREWKRLQKKLAFCLCTQNCNRNPKDNLGPEHPIDGVFRIPGNLTNQQAKAIREIVGINKKPERTNYKNFVG